MDRGQHKYCSQTCAKEEKKEKNREKWIEKECKNCGKIFKIYKSKVKRGDGKYCCASCAQKGLKVKKVKHICKECGKSFMIRPSDTKRGRGKYCSKKCKHKAHSKEMKGNKTHLWKGGITSYKYCEKFNNDFKTRCRAFWTDKLGEYKCPICGKTHEEEGRHLSVHHINYNKENGCNNHKGLFIPTCNSCHGKTNSHREWWEMILSRMINEFLNGKSYYTKEEFEKINEKIP